MITITENAAQQLRHLIELKNAPSSSGLRIRVEKGGCAGWQYTMKVDDIQPLDRVFQQHGVHLIVDPESLAFLDNSQIDYVEALNDSGFRVENPNAARNCGCGTSFEPKIA
jgi:iron-sulfur cluster assembly accessory protein